MNERIVAIVQDDRDAAGKMLQVHQVFRPCGTWNGLRAMFPSAEALGYFQGC
jgi:hypothetical protein